MSGNEFQPFPYNVTCSSSSNLESIPPRLLLVLNYMYCMSTEAQIFIYCASEITVTCFYTMKEEHSKNKSSISERYLLFLALYSQVIFTGFFRFSTLISLCRCSRDRVHLDHLHISTENFAWYLLVNSSWKPKHQLLNFHRVDVRAFDQSFPCILIYLQ